MSFYFISLSLGLTQDRWVFGGGRGSTVVAFRLDRSKAKRDILWFCLFVKYGPCEGTCLRCLFFYATPSPVLLSSIKFHHSPFLLLCSNRCLPLSRELEGAEIGGGEEWRAGRKRREWSLLFGCFWEDLHLNSHSSQWSWLVSLLVCWLCYSVQNNKKHFFPHLLQRLCLKVGCVFFLSLSLAVPFVASADYGGLDWFGCVKSQIAQGETCSFHVWSGVWDVNKKCSSLASEDYSFLSSMGSWDHRRWKHQCASGEGLAAC